MICPQDGHHCGCHASEFCVIRKPPKPTLAEIERLVDAYGVAHFKTHGDVEAARAALMAAIKQYVEG